MVSQQEHVSLNLVVERKVWAIEGNVIFAILHSYSRLANDIANSQRPARLTSRTFVSPFDQCREHQRRLRSGRSISAIWTTSGSLSVRDLRQTRLTLNVVAASTFMLLLYNKLRKQNIENHNSILSNSFWNIETKDFRAMNERSERALLRTH